MGLVLLSGSRYDRDRLRVVINRSMSEICSKHLVDLTSAPVREIVGHKQGNDKTKMATGGLVDCE